MICMAVRMYDVIIVYDHFETGEKIARGEREKGEIDFLRRKTLFILRLWRLVRIK